MADRNQFRKDMADGLGEPVDGVATAVLHRDPRETVTFSHLDAGATLKNADPGGIELLVIAGSVAEGDQTLGKGGWLRLPDGAPLMVVAGSDGAKLWMKTGHLLHAKPPAV